MQPRSQKCYIFMIWEETIMASNVIAVRNLGRMAYKPAIDLMKSYEKRKLDFVRGHIQEEPKDTLFLVEHNPVYTIGNRTANYHLGQSNNESDEIDQRLRELGADFCLSDRGGLITFHGPGQLVCYPVLNLKRFTPRVRWYVNSLEDVIIDTCAEFGVFVGRTNDIGVWIEDRKIAALGIHVNKYITSHGLALNCNTDLTWFSHIIPCGIADKTVTSLSHELNKNITIQDVMPLLLKNFKNKFKCELIEDD